MWAKRQKTCLKTPTSASPADHRFQLEAAFLGTCHPPDGTPHPDRTVFILVPRIPTVPETGSGEHHGGSRPAAQGLRPVLRLRRPAGNVRDGRRADGRCTTQNRLAPQGGFWYSFTCFAEKGYKNSNQGTDGSPAREGRSLLRPTVSRPVTPARWPRAVRPVGSRVPRDRIGRAVAPRPPFGEAALLPLHELHGEEKEPI